MHGTAKAPVDVLVLYEHPEWQVPLFSALERRGLRFAAFDLKAAAFDPGALPEARLVFNQASPSAATRGHVRAVPLALSLLRTFEAAGTPVVNGHQAFALELSKSAQLALLKRLGIPAPRTVVFNSYTALSKRVPADFPWPALIKPDLGGSGARMQRVYSLEEVQAVVQDASLWSPDPVLLLQEELRYDRDRGIVRLELLGGELLYAMRVVSHGGFNLCPSEVCHPAEAPTKEAVEFYPYPEVPDRAVQMARAMAKAGGFDIAGFEYADVDGTPVFYDLNANSNLRPAIGAEFGFDPFERVVDELERRLALV